MNFAEWLEKLPYDERAALCHYDVWKGAIESAISSAKEEDSVDGCIKSLKGMIEE